MKSVKRIFQLCIVPTVLFVAAAQVSAHHSFANYDMDTRVALQGTVSKFNWRNPHASVQVDVVNAEGESATWILQMLSPNILRRMGWNRNTLKQGDKVAVVYHPLRSGARGGNLITIADESGKEIGGPQHEDL